MKNRIKYKIKLIKEIVIKQDDYKIIQKMNKFNKILFYLKRVFQNLKKLIDIFVFRKLYVYYVEMVLTTVCTLNCMGCSALMDYYSKKSHINLNENINALQNMIKVCDIIEHLRLLGGEPLCYPKLYEILEYLNNQVKVKKVTIVTNGTLLIKDNRILEILKNEKFNVYISDYGLISRKKNELINQLKNNNIKYIVPDEDRMWRDYGNLECRNRSEKELCNQFINCRIMCNSILNGKLHHCPRSSHGTNLKKIPLREIDYIDLLDNNLTKKQLYNFFFKYVSYIETCNYCNAGTNDLKQIPPGKQL